MITRRTKIQLMIFVLITLFGVTFVGARYAQLDKAFYDDNYTVTANFADSGGIFAGGEVTYRGVSVGKVNKLELTDEGVDVVLDIDNGYDEIPADTLAVVGNRSAVGEQYVELQPQRDDGPYLHNGSVIDEQDTRLPIATDTLLTHLSETVESVNKDDLKTTVDELGAAFAGTGEDLQTIIDSGNSFINTANDNFDVTTALIRDSNTVLHGQIDCESAIRNFSAQLQAVQQRPGRCRPRPAAPHRHRRRRCHRAADLPRGEPRRARRPHQQPGHHRRRHRQAPRRHQADPGDLPLRRRGWLHGGLEVTDTGLYDAHFGMIITNQKVCHEGYGGTDTRPPQDGGSRPMNVGARCDEPATQSNARGAQNAPRAATSYADSPVVASYDPETGKLTWGDPTATATAGFPRPVPWLRRR